MVELHKLEYKPVTLVDNVERELLEYIKVNNLKVGSALPGEMELSSHLGVARSVLREALSRLKMMGVIESRARRGMILREPSIFESLKWMTELKIMSEGPMLDILGLRVVLELGMVNDIFERLTDKDIEELTRINNVSIALKNNEYDNPSEYNFHSKLYEITGNHTLMNFQQLFSPIITFIKQNFDEYIKPINNQLEKEGKIVTHDDLLQHLKNRDREGFRDALDKHLMVYRIFIAKRRSEE